MKNKSLSKTKDAAMIEMKDFFSTAESIISDLVEEIETLEQENEALQKEVNNLKQSR